MAQRRPSPAASGRRRRARRPPDGARHSSPRSRRTCSTSRRSAAAPHWVNATYITDDTDALAAYFGTIGTEMGGQLRQRGGAVSRTSRASSYDTKRKLDILRSGLVLPAPTTPGAAAELNDDRDQAAVDLRQGQGHAERQADHRQRHRGADGHGPQPGRAAGDVDQLARQCRRADARRLCAHGRDRQRRAPRSSAIADTGAMWRSQLRHAARRVRRR